MLAIPAKDLQDAYRVQIPVCIQVNSPRHRLTPFHSFRDSRESGNPVTSTANDAYEATFPLYSSQQAQRNFVYWSNERLRWQIELVFKEWKSYVNLYKFDTTA